MSSLLAAQYLCDKNAVIHNPVRGATEPKELLPEIERLAQAEAFIAALDIPASFGATHAYYHLAKD